MQHIVAQVCAELGYSSPSLETSGVFLISVSMIFVSQPVLLVEGDEGDRLLIRRSLERLRPSIEINAVTSPGAAQDYLSGTGKYAGAPRPECIVLDLTLPDGGGEGLLDWLGRSDALRALPVIALSPQTPARKWPNLVGALRKPSDPEGYERLSAALSALVLAAVDGPIHGNDNFVLGATPDA